jgi:hypothetical protein
MGLGPDCVPHLREASRFVGNSATTVIDQVAEMLVPREVPFQVVPDSDYLRHSV